MVALVYHCIFGCYICQFLSPSTIGSTRVWAFHLMFRLFWPISFYPVYSSCLLGYPYLIRQFFGYPCCYPWATLASQSSFCSRYWPAPRLHSSRSGSLPWLYCGLSFIPSFFGFIFCRYHCWFILALRHLFHRLLLVFWNLAHRLGHHLHLTPLRAVVSSAATVASSFLILLLVTPVFGFSPFDF